MHVSTRLSVLVGIIAPALCYNADRINVTDATPETYHEVERIVPTQWEIEIFPGGENETLSGTIEQAIREAQDRNPAFRAYNARPVEKSLHKPPPLDKNKYKPPPSDKNKFKLKLKPDHGNVAAHAPHAPHAGAVAGDEWPPADHPMFGCDMDGVNLGFRKKPLCPDGWRPDEECYRVRPWWVGCNAPAESPGDGAVQCYNQSPAGANKTTIKYDVYTMFERYPGPPPPSTAETAPAAASAARQGPPIKMYVNQATPNNRVQLKREKDMPFQLGIQLSLQHPPDSSPKSGGQSPYAKRVEPNKAGRRLGLQTASRLNSAYPAWHSRSGTLARPLVWSTAMDLYMSGLHTTTLFLPVPIVFGAFSTIAYRGRGYPALAHSSGFDGASSRVPDSRARALDGMETA
ncbi:hypothetical protein PG984_016594 [Apiospora sp. TS-2023a]